MLHRVGARMRLRISVTTHSFASASIRNYSGYNLYKLHKTHWISWCGWVNGVVNGVDSQRIHDIDNAIGPEIPLCVLDFMVRVGQWRGQWRKFPKNPRH